jgi:hypothetical protein
VVGEDLDQHRREAEDRVVGRPSDVAIDSGSAKKAR